MFGMEPIIVIGAVAGWHTAPPYLKAIQQQAKTAIPCVGHPVPYSLSALIGLIHGYIAVDIS